MIFVSRKATRCEYRNSQCVVNGFFLNEPIRTQRTQR